VGGSRGAVRFVKVCAIALALSAAAWDAAAPAAAQASAPYPVTVTDCRGVTSTFTGPPQRVLALGTTILEPLFWLGVEDSVIASSDAVQDGTFPPQFLAEGQQVRDLLGPYVPGGSFQPLQKEALLAEQPDFVLSAFAGYFDRDGTASQADLAERGIPSYYAFSTTCAELDEPFDDLSAVYRDLENLGAIFGVPDRAAELIDGMQARVDGVAERLAGVSERPSVVALEYSEGTETPYVDGNRQTINAVINLAGGRNAFGDLDTYYEQIGWEEIIARDPDVILIVAYGYGGEEAYRAEIEAAKEFLRAYPPIQSLRAVREQRFAHMNYFVSSVGGVRNAEAVELLAKQLHPEAFD
jgi:iron complex transport system substrate-binding protein